MDLTYAERAFLQSQKIRPEQVFDGRGMSNTEWKERSKFEEKSFVLATPCTDGGHRLKTRGGHCIQCKTANIGFMRKNSEAGYVYIAASRSAKLLKVGCALDIEQRARNLCVHKYGGYDDWEVIAWAKTKEIGKVEFEVLKKLEQLKVEGEYFKDGKMQATRELLQGKLIPVWRSFLDQTSHAENANRWKHHRFADFNFVN